jgi:hypothetical protein
MISRILLDTWFADAYTWSFSAWQLLVSANATWEERGLFCLSYWVLWWRERARGCAYQRTSHCSADLNTHFSVLFNIIKYFLKCLCIKCFPDHACRGIDIFYFRSGCASTLFYFSFVSFSTLVGIYIFMWLSSVRRERIERGLIKKGNKNEERTCLRNFCLLGPMT